MTIAQAGLYRSPDGGLSLIPAGPYEPGELGSNDELGLLSSSNPTPPLHHPGITEPQDSEVRYYPFIHLVLT
jgi:hypothetical protein